MASIVVRSIAAALVLMAVSPLVEFSASAASAASRRVPTCFHDQLEVAVAWDVPPAAGSNGIPFIIANTSKTTCSVEGYPKLAFDPGTYKKWTLKTYDGGGNMFPAVKPRLVVIKPGADASFGINFGDASNQEDPSGAPCTTQDVEITLPVKANDFPQNYEAPIEFNFCSADFGVEVTSLESGPLPKER